MWISLWYSLVIISESQEGSQDQCRHQSALGMTLHVTIYDDLISFHPSIYPSSYPSTRFSACPWVQMMLTNSWAPLLPRSALILAPQWAKRWLLSVGPVPEHSRVGQHWPLSTWQLAPNPWKAWSKMYCCNISYSILEMIGTSGSVTPPHLLTTAALIVWMLLWVQTNLGKSILRCCLKRKLGCLALVDRGYVDFVFPHGWSFLLPPSPCSWEGQFAVVGKVAHCFPGFLESHTHLLLKTCETNTENTQTNSPQRGGTDTSSSSAASGSSPHFVSSILSLVISYYAVSMCLFQLVTVSP